MASSLSPISFALVAPIHFLSSQYQYPSHEATTFHPLPASTHQDADGKCIFSKKSYWDSMYQGCAVDDRPSDLYSWYCGWDQLAPFWSMLVPDRNSARVLNSGIGNDPAPIHMYDAGWSCNMMAFDYSDSGVKRARTLFGDDRMNVTCITADAHDLPLADGSIDATLDKGTLDAIYITGMDLFNESIKELGRVTAKEGMVVSISNVIYAEDLIGAFDSPLWECIHDGTLAFAPDEEATIDLGAELFSWKRSHVTWHP